MVKRSTSTYWRVVPNFHLDEHGPGDVRETTWIPGAKAARVRSRVVVDRGLQVVNRGIARPSVETFDHSQTPSAHVVQIPQSLASLVSVAQSGETEAVEAQSPQYRSARLFQGCSGYLIIGDLRMLSGWSYAGYSCLSACAYSAMASPGVRTLISHAHDALITKI